MSGPLQMTYKFRCQDAKREFLGWLVCDRDAPLVFGEDVDLMAEAFDEAWERVTKREAAKRSGMLG